MDTLGYRRDHIVAQWLRDPSGICRLRVELLGRYKELDIWSVDELDLIGDKAGELRLYECFAGRSRNGLDRDKSSGAMTYIATPTRYEPYHSRCIEPNAIGAHIFDRALEAMECEALDCSVMKSPLSALAMVTAASRWLMTDIAPEASCTVSRKLCFIARWAPKKGGEISAWGREYYAHRPLLDVSDIPAMVLRDYFSSLYAWQFIRSDDPQIHDLSGSIISLTAAIDYVGAPDDSGARIEDFQLVTSDGLDCLGGVAPKKMLQGGIVACLVMKLKQYMVNAMQDVPELPLFVASAGGIVTPREFFLLRYWDAAMPQYLQIIMNSSRYCRLVDASGYFRSMSRCGKLKRATDNIVRYNEVTDVVSDHQNGEVLNEVFFALLSGGVEAVRGYGSALSAVTDDVLSCRCGELGHEEAAELSMGGCIWQLLMPRYQVWRQLYAYAHSQPEIESAYAAKSASARLHSVFVTMLAGDVLHTDNWMPLWKMSFPSESNNEALIAELARRAVRRSVLIERCSEGDFSRCETAAKSALYSCYALDDVSVLRGLSCEWIRLFDVCLRANNIDVSGAEDIVRALKEVVGRIWKGVVTMDAQVADETEQLFIDCDSVVRQTYFLPYVTGLSIRRVFFGVASGAVELSGFSPFARLSDGVVNVCDISP
ncbi:hypothetical protein DYL59_17760 [Pseudomonas kairouanensis]|uniref:Uncharacterized protein n=1 Tax=Pseudomonas kairouanensis TaxID=2293832 RepID=A0A4Z0ALX3_9PSED|nr:hypothetical protein [Pseudomonas kairouanensis]TFY87635.1 hypothetical protein DYL59_17760 [Pseudomonas kairouanensis]